MGRTMINVGAIMDATGQINSAKSSVNSAKSSFGQTKNSINSKIKDRSNIRSRLNTVQNQLNNISTRIGNISAMVQSGATLYRTTDDKVDSMAKNMENRVGGGKTYISGVYGTFFSNDGDIEEIKKKKVNTNINLQTHIHPMVDPVTASKLAKVFWETLKEQITRIPEDIETAGESLGWIEEQYGKLPKWFTQGVHVIVPSSLETAYTLTSGLLQGDLTAEEGWDAVTSILKKNTTLGVICETINYTLEKGMERSAEMDEKTYEQLAEGDILGVVFAGAEGFVDTIIGGTIDVLGDVGGGAIDTAIDNIPVVKGLNMLTEYGTGLLGLNEGEGYSLGGLVGAGAEKLSDGLDVATDFITEKTDIVTDAVTEGFKSGIKWVKSLF